MTSQNCLYCDAKRCILRCHYVTVLCDEKAFLVRCIAENDLQVSYLLTIRDNLMLFRVFGSDKNKVLKISEV